MLVKISPTLQNIPIWNILKKWTNKIFIAKVDLIGKIELKVWKGRVEKKTDCGLLIITNLKEYRNAYKRGML
jgi:hypothetical protein